MPPTQAHTTPAGQKLKAWTRKAVVLLSVTLTLGWFYGWASSWAFPREKRAGFGYGMLHGALMPMALPSLLMGKDVDIYNINNSGRTYKLGYIVGINLCGLVFFGSAFWRTGRKPPPVAPVPGAAHKSPPE